MRKRTIVIALSALAAAALAGGAYAATQSSSPSPPHQILASERAFINDAASRLHVSTSQLTAALRGALLDRIDALTKAGHIPSKLAAAIRQRIEHGPMLPLGPVPLLAFGAPGPLGLAGAARIQVAPGPRGVKALIHTGGPAGPAGPIHFRVSPAGPPPYLAWSMGMMPAPVVRAWIGRPPK